MGESGEKSKVRVSGRSRDQAATVFWVGRLLGVRSKEEGA